MHASFCVFGIHYGSGPQPCVCVCVCVGTCMLVCVWYTELTGIPDVQPSGRYGSGPWPCVSVCVGAGILGVFGIQS